MSSRRPRPAGAPPADPQADISSDRAPGGSPTGPPDADRRVGATRRGDPDFQPNRTGFLAATSADFDGAANDELVQTVGLLVEAGASDEQLAFLARELTEHVERREARVAIEQLRRPLDRLGDCHQTANERVARPRR